MLVCPRCKKKLKQMQTKLICPHCKNQYPIKKGKIFFNQVDVVTEINDPVDQFKYRFKKFPKLYYFVIYILSPVALINIKRRFIGQFRGITLNLGSGNQVFKEEIYNIDLFPYENVDIVCNIKNLPVKEDSVDNVMSIAVLEHITEPEEVIDETQRVLKQGGKVFTLFPFMVPYHASPDDYTRVTISGIERLHRKFELIDKGISAGPTSGFLWVLQEWLSLLFCFGSRRLKSALYFILMFLTFPLKGVDFVLKSYPGAENISSSFYYLGKKK